MTSPSASPSETVSSETSGESGALASAEGKVPVTVLTGFLGAGKTTLLNHILTAEHGRKYAVVVNEFGELGIDNDLVVDADEEVFEMNNGCICCTVRGDLIRVMGRLLRKKDRFDGIIVETTGLADPASVAQTFFVDETVRDKARLDAVVTVVDAVNGLETLKQQPEAINQIAFADVIILNKCDLASEAQQQAMFRAIRQLNSVAPVHKAVRGDVRLTDVLDRGGFDLNRALANMPAFLEEGEGAHDHAPAPPHEHDHEHGHEHDHDCQAHRCTQDHDYAHDHISDSGISSHSFTLTEPLDEKRFQAWIGLLLQEKGADILRAKGILHFRGEPRRFVFQAVHMMAEGGFLPPAKGGGKGGDDTSRLVFIGRHLNGAELQRGFERCVAA
ncbi:CobW family GTP-binding protein [Oecophyllibacter saccharovorans]|uniref:GTP-binding protein n=1 Tax=Oecophyllibacter saccharovorans TaxID=2558360 RepID=A0A506ULT8_9PROT|nr:GTP-binding protein [Oecophyllibacter saccharovorans]TPW34306.1 GTP-binding protein [Oecophyllibacter saccharovorans]